MKVGIIEDLENEQDIIILVIGEGHRKNWQLPTNVVNYVRSNFELIGSIDIFNVYTK